MPSRCMLGRDTTEDVPTGDGGWENRCGCAEGKMDGLQKHAASVYLGRGSLEVTGDFLGSDLFPGGGIGAAHSLVHGLFHISTSQASFLLALF